MSRLSKIKGSGAQSLDTLRDQPQQQLPAAQSRQQQESSETDTGYKVPPKRRTTPRIAELRKKLRPKLLSTPDEMDQWSTRNPEHRKVVSDRLRTILQRSGIQVAEAEYRELEEALMNDLLGFGSIEPMVQSTEYKEIMVNGPEIIFAESRKLFESEFVFDDEDHIQWTAQRIVRPLQRDFSRRNPMVDARLPDGSRVHLIMPPSALCGTTITIRKFPAERLTWKHLVGFGSFTEEVAMFLKACVEIRLNMVVSGGTGSGKTTLLNVISSFIPEDERTITVEDSAELQLSQRHVVRLETCPALPGTDEGRLVIRDLVKGCLRMRPDRIVVGEIRDGAAFDMLQAMNTGHDGSLTTLHANGPREAISRLETMCMMAGMDIPIEAIRSQIASAIHLFVQQARLKDGSRKIIQITEVQGMEGQNVTLQDLFVYKTPNQKEPGPSHDGGGKLEATGMKPRFEHRFEEMGIELPRNTFGDPSKMFQQK